MVQIETKTEHDKDKLTYMWLYPFPGNDIYVTIPLKGSMSNVLAVTADYKAKKSCK